MSAFVVQIIRDHVDLADALAALKNFRGLSNESLEHLTGLARGHVDKMLGPNPQKSIGKATLKYLLLALAGRLVLELDPEQEKLMASRWERRNHKQIHNNNAHPISSIVLQRAMPVIFAQLSRKAALARLTKIPKAERKRIAQRAGKARWQSKKAAS
jgi:hypothetical protein